MESIARFSALMRVLSGLGWVLMGRLGGGSAGGFGSRCIPRRCEGNALILDLMMI